MEKIQGSSGLKETPSQAVVVAHMPLIPALGRQRQADVCEYEASLVYRASSRTIKATLRNPVMKNQNQTKQKHKKLPWSCDFRFFME